MDKKEQFENYMKKLQDENIELVILFNYELNALAEILMMRGISIDDLTVEEIREEIKKLNEKL